MFQSGVRLAVVAVLACAAMVAQTGAGTIQGTVKDATGAVAPKVQVKIVHAVTSTARETETNEVGFFTFPAVRIGRYRITVQSAGQPWRTAARVKGDPGRVEANHDSER
jgi:hypothetical protein